MKTKIAIIIGILTIASILCSVAMSFQSTKSKVELVDTKVCIVAEDVDEVKDAFQVKQEQDHSREMEQMKEQVQFYTAQMVMNEQVKEFMMEFKDDDN